jgi:hypothetical protein
LCQAVTELNYVARCYAVDTWAGDSQTGYYGDSVYNDLVAYHRQYASFSQLLRMSFDSALERFPERTIDLLHIDGLHTYEAVKNDYMKWLPKVSDRGIILFHDTAVTEPGFGVHELWAELSNQYPHFAFEHGYGLGVLAVGPSQSPEVLGLLDAANRAPSGTRMLFSSLGAKIVLTVQLEKKNQELQKLQSQVTTVRSSHAYRWGGKLIWPLRMVKSAFRGTN